jgi:hypothetical protein
MEIKSLNTIIDGAAFPPINSIQNPPVTLVNNKVLTVVLRTADENLIRLRECINVHEVFEKVAVRESACPLLKILFLNYLTRPFGEEGWKMEWNEHLYPQSLPIPRYALAQGLCTHLVDFRPHF